MGNLFHEQHGRGHRIPELRDNVDMLISRTSPTEAYSCHRSQAEVGVQALWIEPAQKRRGVGELPKQCPANGVAQVSVEDDSDLQTWQRVKQASCKSFSLQ